MDLEKVKFSLGQLVESQAEVLMAKAREKDLTLMTYIDPQVPQDVHGDPGRIGQILLNLMGNAIKFSSRGGVTVSVTRVAERIRFDVQDTGIGISRDAQMRLFKPFTQADRSTSRKYGGTGLGLSISKRLVELMEGDIGVNSMIGAGSVFWFELPFVGLEAPKLVHLKGRALLIEGDPVASPILNRYLRAWGLDCQPLKTTNVTAESLSTYDVVVIGNGRNVGASHLEQLAQLKDISPPIILLNEMGQSIDSQLSEALEITTLVSNPLKGLALYEALVQALGVKVESVKDFDIPQIAPPVLEIKKSTARILVAEDVKVNQLLVLKQLEHLGYTAHVVANGNEVIEALGRVEYDLVLMDCQMPELDGFEATKLIRKSHDEYMRTIPIIALTANAMSGDDKICLAAGMNDYLSKPFKRETLQAKLEYWLAQKAPPRQAA